MKKVITKGPRNVLMTNELIFFTLSLSQINCMAQGSKITFSKAELDAMISPDFFYTKHAAMQNVMELLSETEREIRKIVVAIPEFAVHTNIESPKIFRGENYRQLPYIVLDYPRHFSTDSVFAFRSMFWWGKEFSFTLHLQGKAWEYYRNRVTERLSTLSGKDFYCCVNDSPWQYYFENDNYVLLDELLKSPDFIPGFQSRNFLKLCTKTEIKDFARVPEYASGTLELLLKLLQEL